ncbi:SMI1/KNR4 family protein [Chitinophaga oryzae]|uniref:SMI1/KNR4 family protein n=2 Tax=Chitinophaga oryzae TaxID=2725414 RepID=A0AAE7D9A4_9BACT|nr:SMI1/KNR4 family protein [Chitinophaga oryzae]QJB34052.1 SMI1/KNR4 family protein [Chitinophaga oryzae]
MQEYWTRWENWMRQHAPRLLHVLNPGVSTASLESLEKLTESALPADFKAFYAVHDGQQKPRPGLVDGDQLLPLEEIINKWHYWHDLIASGTFTYNDEPIASEPDTGIRSDWWNPRWIPITADGFGNFLCLDLDPAPGGHYGQIITLWHDDGHREIVAPSFREWISNYLDALEKGDYIFVKKWGIVHKDTTFNYND